MPEMPVSCAIFRWMKSHTQVLASLVLLAFISGIGLKAHGWGFFGHRTINYNAVFLLPPEMMVLYKKHIDFLSEHAVDPDKRRYAVPGEAPRHYIDIDHYGKFPYEELPRQYAAAVEKFSEDTIQAYGTVPWWVQTMLYRLTNAFKEKDQKSILKLSADIGHYISDAHVPLHATSNYNGQLTNQHGIHAFFESRIPELFANRQYDFFIGNAAYISRPGEFIWERVLESAAAVDTVLRIEATLMEKFPGDTKYAYEERLGRVVRQYSTAYSKAYEEALQGMIERRMRESIFAVASFWYTAWVDAGQPDLTTLNNTTFSEEELKAYEELNAQWLNGRAMGRICD